MGIRSRVRPYAYNVEKRLYIRAQRRRPGKPVVLLTLGKTGSSTVRATLREHLAERPVYQVHTIADDTLRQGEREYRRVSPHVRPEHVWCGLYLRSRMPTAAEPWDVITLVRDPVARAVSAYFQSARRAGRSERPRVAEMTDWLRLRQPDPWFDTQMRDQLAVDVFAHLFDNDRGWQRIDTPAVRLLVIRQENLADSGTEALADFVGSPIPSLVSANVASEKWYAAPYREFRDAAAFPSDVLDEMYESRYARHFYTEDERTLQRDMWTGSADRGTC